MEKRVNRLRTPFFTVLFIFVGLFLYTKFFGPIPFSVNSVTTAKTDVFSVTGEGKAVAVPDESRASVGVTVTRNTVKEVQNEANRIINSITRELRQLSIEEKNIKTENYSINTNYNFQEGQRIPGYTVSTTISVKAPIEKANDVIDTATRNGANVVGSIQFTFADGTKEKLEEQARKEAVDDAKRKAEGLAKASGIALGRIINVSESPTFEPRPIPLLQRVGGPTEGEPTKIEPGESTIAISVTLSYEIR